MLNSIERIKEKKQAKREKKKKIAKIALIVCAFYFIFLFIIIAIGSSQDSKQKEIQWDNLALCEMLPEIENPKGTVNENTDLQLNVDFENIEKDEALEFIESCKSLYTIDSVYTSTEFSAYNSDGYKIEVSYYSVLSVELKSPLEFSDIYWPENEAGKLLPQPKSLIGKIESETSDEFVAYISEMTKEDYNEYVYSCQKAGFNIDYIKDETSFQASHKNGYQLNLKYEGFNIISVDIMKNDAYIIEENSEEESTTQEETSMKEKTTEETTLEETVFEETTTELETTESTTTTTESTTKITTSKEPTTTQTTTKVTTTKETTTKAHGRTVYITPTGKKYHYSSSCAGKNAMERDYYDVVDSYGPCKKCAS